MAFSKCPWCGGEARVDITEYIGGSRQVGFAFRVKCSKCGAAKGKIYHILFELKEDGTIRTVRDEMEHAEREWNTRVMDFKWEDGAR